MLRGMAIPGDGVEEEEEGMSKESVQAVVGHHLVSCPRVAFHPLLSQETLERR